MKMFKTLAALAALSLLTSNGARARPTADIKVMTQNQYLGADLTPIIEAVSQHDERIDVVFAFPAPASVKANVLDAEAGDKTLSGHWPSDHASVSAELAY